MIGSGLVEPPGKMRAAKRVNVLLTIDTEVYPLDPQWREDGLSKDLDRDIYGRTPEGEFGLDYQLQVFDHHDLRAVFMVEPLFASAPEVGTGPLRRIVTSIRTGGHDIQLHPHPEWVPFIPELAGNLQGSGLINSYPHQQQRQILRTAIANLTGCGAPYPRAFRAGDYAANADTLHALRDEGLVFDTSYNICYLDTKCLLRTPAALLQPAPIDGIWEFPISFFEDLPGHYRPAQICACSAAEMISALEQAYASGWEYFVIVSHSFELLRNRRKGSTAHVRTRAVQRFERLCAFLDKNRDRFPTATFSELPVPVCAGNSGLATLKGNVFQTAWRMGEQFLDRLSAKAGSQ